MKTVFIIIFCTLSWISLGLIAGNVMLITMSIDIAPATVIGATYGAKLGLLFSLFFISKRKHENIFTILAICFVLSFPIALISGFTANHWLAIVLTALSYLSVYYILLRGDSHEEKLLFNKKTIYIIPLLCLFVASTVAYNYEDKSLPDDMQALIELMGDNNIGTHTDAARKLRKVYGKEPFLIAIKHEDHRVRAVAAHFLMSYKEVSVQEALIETSKDSNEHVRMWVAFSLGKIGNADSLPTLNILVNDKAEIVSRHAEEAIGKVQKRID